MNIKGSTKSTNVFDLLKNLKLKSMLTIKNSKILSAEAVKVCLSLAVLYYDALEIPSNFSEFRENSFLNEKFAKELFEKTSKFHKTIQNTLQLLNEAKIPVENVVFSKKLIAGLSLSSFQSNSLHESIINVFCFVRDFIEFFSCHYTLSTPFTFSFETKSLSREILKTQNLSDRVISQTPNIGIFENETEEIFKSALISKTNYFFKKESIRNHPHITFSPILDSQNGFFLFKEQTEETTQPFSKKDSKSHLVKKKKNEDQGNFSRHLNKKMRSTDQEDDLSYNPPSNLYNDVKNSSLAQSHSSEFHIQSEMSSFSQSQNSKNLFLDKKKSNEFLGVILNSNEEDFTNNYWNKKESSNELLKLDFVPQKTESPTSLKHIRLKKKSTKNEMSPEIVRNSVNQNKQLFIENREVVNPFLKTPGVQENDSFNFFQQRSQFPVPPVSLKPELKPDDFDFFFQQNSQKNQELSFVKKYNSKGQSGNEFQAHPNELIVDKNLIFEAFNLKKEYKSKGDLPEGTKKDNLIDFLNSDSVRVSQSTSQNRMDNVVKISTDLLQFNFAPRITQSPVKNNLMDEKTKEPKQKNGLFIQSQDLFEIKNQKNNRKLRRGKSLINKSGSIVRDSLSVEQRKGKQDSGIKMKNIGTRKSSQNEMPSKKTDYEVERAFNLKKNEIGATKIENLKKIHNQQASKSVNNFSEKRKKPISQNNLVKNKSHKTPSKNVSRDKIKESQKTERFDRKEIRKSVARSETARKILSIKRRFNLSLSANAKQTAKEIDFNKMVKENSDLRVQRNRLKLFIDRKAKTVLVTQNKSRNQNEFDQNRIFVE